MFEWTSDSLPRAPKVLWRAATELSTHSSPLCCCSDRCCLRPWSSRRFCSSQALPARRAIERVTRTPPPKRQRRNCPERAQHAARVRPRANSLLRFATANDRERCAYSDPCNTHSEFALASRSRSTLWSVLPAGVSSCSWWPLFRSRYADVPRRSNFETSRARLVGTGLIVAPSTRPKEPAVGVLGCKILWCNVVERPSRARVRWSGTCSS
jgi:hypothetical protein